ncbi:unnamed protein product [Withania somnifera]
MVGALSVVSSSMVDSRSSPCLCLDARLLAIWVLVIQFCIRVLHYLIGSNFHDWEQQNCTLFFNLKKQTKGRKNLRIVGDLGGQYEDDFSDIKTQILNYFTYKAVRTILNQLNEMNPPQYQWFNDYVTANKPHDGKRFIRNLAKEKQELAEKVMTTRLSLYAKWIKKYDHEEIYNRISDQNVEVMRERLMETVIWPSDDTNKGV